MTYKNSAICALTATGITVLSASSAFAENRGEIIPINHIISDNYRDYERRDIAKYPHFDSAKFNSKIDQALTEACPDPTPDLAKPEIVKTCADSIWKSAYNVSVEASDFMKENQNLGSRQDYQDAQAHLRLCERYAAAMDREVFDSKNPGAYALKSINAAYSCAENIDDAETFFEAFINTDAQSAVLDSIYCFETPKTCKRPTVVEAPGIKEI